MIDLVSVSRPPQTTEEAHAPAEALGARCKECPLYGCRAGPVMGEIVPNAKLVTIGEAPGKQEVESRAPFQGPSGMEYNLGLAQGGVSRLEVSTTNTILCRPPEDFDDYLQKLERDWKKACVAAERDGLQPPSRPNSPVDCCRPRLLKEIELSNSQTLLAIGGKALRAVAEMYGVPYGSGEDAVGKISFATIKGQHGSPVRMPDGKVVCSALHPAFAFRKNHQYIDVIKGNIARAATIASRGNVIDWHEPDFNIFVQRATDESTNQDEAMVRIITLCATLKSQGARVAVDIETDSADSVHCNIRCVGIGAVLRNLDGTYQEVVASIPFKWRDGREYWASQQMKLVVADALRSVLDECELIFHNGLFDTAVLLRFGYMGNRRKRWYDTMLGHHNTDSNDLPHDLGFLARQFTEAPLWKKDVDQKEAAGVARDYDLHFYNCKDVLLTLRLWPFIEERIVACGTVPQMRVDTHLAPVARDMGLLGVWIDETARGDLSLKFNRLCRDLEAKFVQQVGHPINPRSVPQLREWLFGELGLSPTLNTEGYDFEGDDGDDPSTSTPALLKILDVIGADSPQAKMIDTLLEYRACDKLRGTYIDNLRVSYADGDACYVDRWGEQLSPVAQEVIAALGLGEVPEVALDGRIILPKRPAYSRLFINWKLHVVPSGRWACEPTVHNWPSRGWMVDGQPTNVRKMIVAPPGHVLVGADYEQVELRIYGVRANDKYVLKAFRDNLEPHCLNAATILAKTEDEIWPLYLDLSNKHFKYSKSKPKTNEEKEESSYVKYVRTVAKRVAYLKNYGGEDEKLFSAMASERDKATGKRVFPGLKKERVDEWEERWVRRHPETEGWHRQVAARVRAQGFVESLILSHRKRFFVGGPNKKNAPPNKDIQGNAAEMKNEAILRIAEAIPFGCWSPYTGLCLDIHDYLAVFVPESRADEAIKILNKCMYFEMKTDEGWMMPFPADAKASKNLADNA